MNCVQIATLVRRWEQNETISPLEVEAVKEHLSRCSSCAQRYASLIQLFERDAGIIPKISSLSREVPPLDTNHIMAHIEERSFKTFTQRGKQRHLRRFSHFIPWVAAAALLLVVPLGYMLYTNKDSDMVTVRFVLEAPEATTVIVSGNFNQWSNVDIPLHPEGDGKTWSTTIRLKRSFEYRYNFVIDNKIWIPDPNAAVSIDDDFGGKVSLLDL
ncbi:isoamylase early set domain-containing protein [Treponema sp. J25]|uniref:isoamylase early set domain-containing protein n=1 Tax=Treponema sp. J25 TaxID=2094121 RepID=UPI001A9DAB97|nr:isoamylase early set domain-containing protein [Treponema sp. J25]